MELKEKFNEFLTNTLQLRTSIEESINSNAEIYNIDLNSLKNTDRDLYIAIQQGYIQKEKILQECFSDFCLSNFGKTLDLSFSNPSVHVKIRDLRAAILGDLVSFSGTATRTTQVRPELKTAVFICRDCNTKITDVEQEFKFTQPILCPNHLCANRSKFDLDLTESSFSNWQRIHVQESTDEIPGGSLPRTIDLIIRNGLVEKIKPGAHLKYTGYCVAIPDVLQLGLCPPRSLPTSEGAVPEKQKRNLSGKELAYKIAFYCIHADIVAEVKYDDFSSIKMMQSTPNLYEKLSESLFPTIHGHPNIKSAILLMLVGGVKKCADIRLRGDINILLVGDPGTAKSQFLKQTSSFLPKSVYTSGKSSSAAGLTAAVVKDGESGEFTIEAGALMLSDEGVCCIDEFDKMGIKDQVSIHEAMEQQTITVTKAGINATINTRASVLAAANPIRGRYDKRKTLRQNVNLSPPIMSRFDLYFILIDEIDPENDRRVASKILENHEEFSQATAPRDGFSAPGRATQSLRNSMERPFTVQEVLTYISHVKDLKPVMSDDGKKELIKRYVSLRQDSLVNTNNYRMTVRHLESLIRLSEALAKIHNDENVGVQYVQEAYRLLKSSVIEVSGEDIEMVCKETEQTVSIKSKDYLKISNSLVYLVKTGSYSREELSMKYLELIEETIDSTAMLEAEKEKALKVLEFLISHEGVMYEVDDVVNIHPNYDN